MRPFAGNRNFLRTFFRPILIPIFASALDFIVSQGTPSNARGLFNALDSMEYPLNIFMQAGDTLLTIRYSQNFP
jgi:hypothetical protein